MENLNRDFIWKKIAISICGRGTGINKSGSGNTTTCGTYYNLQGLIT